jgi:hypothetical protein
MHILGLLGKLLGLDLVGGTSYVRTNICFSADILHDLIGVEFVEVVGIEIEALIMGLY